MLIDDFTFSNVNSHNVSLSPSIAFLSNKDSTAKVIMKKKATEICLQKENN